MINLSGHKDSDRIILEELFVAGITPVREEKPYGEPNTIWSGKLRDFTFRRAWYYWVVKGKVHLPLAIKMYEQEPYGRRDVRVAGHCGCPHPLEYAEYVDSDGIILCKRMNNGVRTTTAEFFDKYNDGTLSEVLRQVMESQGFFKTHRIVDDPAAEGIGYIDTYHIDSQAGLKVFVDAVNGL